jgi:HPt (histidine-containing phosphotransfer) domain-containing protein
MIFASIICLPWLQVPGTWQKGREALKAVLTHYRRPQVSSQLPPLPFPDLTPGCQPTQEQLAQLMAATGAIALHAYVTMYVCQLTDRSAFKQEALRQLDAGGAALFLEAAHQVASAAVTAGAQHGSSELLFWMSARRYRRLPLSCQHSCLVTCAPPLMVCTRFRLLANHFTIQDQL